MDTPTDDNPFSLMWAVIDWHDCPCEAYMWEVSDLDHWRQDQGIPSAFE